MSIEESVLKAARNRFLQVDRLQTAADAFLLLASPQVDGQGWWHLVVLKSNGLWTAVRFSSLFEEAGKNPGLLDTPLDQVEELRPIHSVERGAVSSGEAEQLARRSPGQLLAVSENQALAGIIFEGGMRGGGPFPSQEALRQLADSPRRAEPEPRYTDISCPRRVSRQTDRFSLVVRLPLQPNPLSAATEKLEPHSDRAVQVLIQAPGFKVLGPHLQKIELKPGKDSPPVVFDLRPNALGALQISLEFYQDGNPLGTVGVPVEVIEEPVAEVSGGPLRQKLPDAPEAKAPDMTLRIAWDKEQGCLKFGLMRQGGAYWQEFPAVPLEQGPSDYAQGLFGDLTQWSEAYLQESTSMVAGPQGLSTSQIDLRLEKLGHNLWREALPEKLKDLYEEERDQWKDGTTLILSDEPYLPWELLWPYGDGWKDEAPWCLTLRLSRWLYADERGNGDPSPPGRLPLSSLLLLAADPSLHLVKRERDYLIRLMKSRGVRPLVPDPASWERIMEMLEGGEYDWLHMAGHSEFCADAPDRHSRIHLNRDERLSPMEFVGPEVEGHLRRRRPAFVMNACHAARQGFGLTRLDGWAARLIGMGAGMFLGPLWAVSETSSLGLTRTLYQALLDGKPLAEALREARRASRRIGSPAWLAYSLYGHPNARLKLRPAEEQPDV